jgi:hypothetical protein
MKAFLRAQINPTKTMEQIVKDRDLWRLFIVAGLLMAVCG